MVNIPTTTPSPPQPLLALHGWGFNRAVWDEVGKQLREIGHGFTAVDLPGFGGRPMIEGDYTLPRLADSVIQALPPGPCAVMGWSLGGLVALEIARRCPERVEALVLVASAPRFTNTHNWPHGVPPAILEGFSTALVENHRTALLRFLILQAGRTDLGRETVKKLRPLLFRDGGPDRRALEQGLALLRESDYRHVLSGIRQPVLFVLGGRDNFLAASAEKDLARLCPHAEVAVIQGSAHAPFISHPVEFLGILTSFLANLP